MRKVQVKPAFLRDIKRLKQKHYDMQLLLEAEAALRRNDRALLTTRYRDHQLKGNLSAFRELHIQGDWLLVYFVEGEQVTLARTGTHDGLL